MDDAEPFAPEKGGAVGDGEDACVDDAGQSGGPVLALAQGRGGPVDGAMCEQRGSRTASSSRCQGGLPVFAVEVLSIQVVYGQASGCKFVEILHSAGSGAREGWSLAASSTYVACPVSPARACRIVVYSRSSSIAFEVT